MESKSNLKKHNPSGNTLKYKNAHVNILATKGNKDIMDIIKKQEHVGRTERINERVKKNIIFCLRVLLFITIFVIHLIKMNTKNNNYDYSKEDLDNHSNQLNPNNDAYHQSRGEEERPEDWEKKIEEEY